MSNSKYKKPYTKLNRKTVLKEILIAIGCQYTFDKYHQKVWRNQDIRKVKKVANIVYGDKNIANDILRSLIIVVIPDSSKIQKIIEILKADKEMQEIMLNEIMLRRL